MGAVLQGARIARRDGLADFLQGVRIVSQNKIGNFPQEIRIPTHAAEPHGFV
jgi:hypothetical protein